MCDRKNKTLSQIIFRNCSFIIAPANQDANNIDKQYSYATNNLYPDDNNNLTLNS